MDTKNPRKLSTKQIEMKKVPLKSINTAGRSRRDYGEVKKLQQSILDKGLIHPLVVMRNNEEKEKSTGFKYFLLAGGRRTKAIKNLEWEEAPVRIFPSDLNGYEIRSIELEENLKRKDLTDAERIKMIKTVHDLWTQMYGDKEHGLKDGKGHSKRDTARELGVSHTKINKDLEIAEWMERVPALEKLKDRKKIRSAIEDAKKKVRRRKKFQEAGIDKENQDTKEIEKCYIKGDFFEEVKKLTKGTFDFIDLDIDYPMEIVEETNLSATKDKKEKRYVGIDKKEYPKLMKDSLQACYDLLDDGGWCIIWFGVEYREKLIEWGKEIGFKTRIYNGDWYKGEAYANCRNAEYLLKHSCEHFFYFSKGTAILNNVHADHFQFAPVPVKQRSHPYEKPIFLMKEIIQTFVGENSNIFVPFAGSGNTLIAGKMLNCNVSGTELGDYQDDFKYKVRQMQKKGLL